MRIIAIAAGIAALCLIFPAAADTTDEILQQGRVAEKNGDFDTAEKLFRQAADQGSVDAERALGEHYYGAAAFAFMGGKDESGTGAAALTQAVTWFTKAAEHGDTGAQANLGAIYEYEPFGIRDQAKSYKWFLAAAQGGDAKSQYNTAHHLERGEGVTADVGAATGWYRKSAAQGFRPAADALQRLTPPGKDPIKLALHDGLVADDAGDSAAALKAYRRAAALGSADGQERLGLALFDDISLSTIRGGLIDNTYKPPASECKEMLDALHKSAAQNNARAMYDLGNLAHFGDCVPQDDDKAMEWYRKAAALGDKQAQDALKPQS